MSRPRGPGLSLLQVVLAATALSVFAGFAIVRWFERDDVTLDNAVKLLAADLRDAQNRAAYQHRALRVAFRPDGEGYSVQDASGREVRAPVGNGTFRRHYARDAVFRGVRVTALGLGPDRAVHYGPYGSALNRAEIELTFRGARRVLRIVDDEGSIEIEGLQDDWQDPGL